VRTSVAAALLLLCACADTIVDLDAQFACAADKDCNVSTLEFWHCIDHICRPDGYDAGTPDAGAPDAGTPDAGIHDAGTPDAGTPDAGDLKDAGPSDAVDGG
jgi:hypothetical protein